jgi:hypothetical protein
VSAKPLWRSFAGGEITPELYGRLDLAKYQTGLARALNFLILPHGPATRRPGFGLVNEAYDSTQAVRLIPFAFSATQTVVLELGVGYIRFFVNGATLLEANVAVASIVGTVVTTTAAHGYATGDWVFILNRFFKITVTGASTFTTADLWSVAANPTASATVCARVYKIASPYAAADLMDLHYTQNSDVLTITHPGYVSKELKRLGATNWTLTSVSYAPTIAAPASPAAAVTQHDAGTTGDRTYDYVVTAIAADGVSESVASTVATSGAQNLSQFSNFNTISWSAVTGAARYFVYRKRGGVFGYIGQSTTLSMIDDNILPDVTKAPPSTQTTLNSGAGEFPSAVAYYEQRRWFAGPTNNPQGVYATRSGTESNMAASVPTQDDDALEFRIASRQQNAIRHLVPLADLIALTVGGEFRIFADNAPSIVPSSLSIKPQGNAGANNVQPALASSSILYVQSQGSRIRELAYNWQQSSYASIDISIMAPHLFNGFTVTDLAYARAPVPALAATRNDGALLTMTYVPEQQVYGWSQNTTANGAFESVCVVSEGSEDVLYALVRRVVNGRTVRYIERQRTRLFVDQADAFFVDSGLSYDGTPQTVFSGLWHLEGQTVSILADGAVHPTRVVTGGAVTLDEAASVVHIGLGYNSDLLTLPSVLEATAAGGQGLTKNVNGVRMRVTQSSTVKAGPSFDRLTEYPARDVADPYGSPPALRTGELRFAISASWNSDGAVCVRQDNPLPLTVMSMALDLAAGG